VLSSSLSSVLLLFSASPTLPSSHHHFLINFFFFFVFTIPTQFTVLWSIRVDQASLLSSVGFAFSYAYSSMHEKVL
jgi:hypothetical protein